MSTMVSALAFFPWIALDEALSIGEVRLLPYRLDSRKETLELVARADVNAIFKAYRNRPTERVRQGMIVEVGDWKSGMEMTDVTAARLGQVRDILAFSALSNRKLFRGHGNYVNADAFALIIQNFLPGQAHYFAYGTRRRDGGTSNTWTNGEFSFQRPLHVATGVRPDVDILLAEALLKLPIDDPVLEAIKEFNAANTDSNGIAAHVELVMVKSALEWLLGIDEKRSSLAKALLNLFPNADAATTKGPLKASWMQKNPTDGRLLAAWVGDFCNVRNSAAHGNGQRGGGHLIWSHHQHLAFASILFPLVVKKVLANRGVLTPTARDKDEFSHVEDYLAFEPFGPEVRANQAPWVEVDSRIRSLNLDRALQQAILESLDKSTLESEAEPGAPAKG
ncbi:hypothetical protein DBR42_04650 [Pelomonas sp. HMWF004]|nr:hypothetical protein DBR42_04650 [Pelomonas sp. HMWF004]